MSIFITPFTVDLMRDKKEAYRAFKYLEMSLKGYPHAKLKEEDLIAIVALFHVVDPIIKLLIWHSLTVKSPFLFQVHGFVEQVIVDINSPRSQIVEEFLTSSNNRLDWLRANGYID